jgi:hypothetical protein
MAVLFTTVKNTNLETVVHFSSAAAESGTLALNTLTASTQALTAGGTPTVDIVKFVCTGELTSKISVVRNSKNVIVGSPENDINIEFNTMGIPVNNDNTSDIVITNGAAKAVTGWLVLRKVAGWSTKVETATYGAYDDETRVGASTTQSGSPDKV